MVYRVVVQINETDPERIPLIINNVVNLKKTLTDAEIKVVAFGPGVQALKKDGPQAAAVGQLASDGVALHVCQITLGRLSMAIEQFIESTTPVPSGVAEIVKLQSEGWIYLRP